MMLIIKKKSFKQVQNQKISKTLTLVIILLVTITIPQISGQGDYNPFVSSAVIDPTPLRPVELNGTGTFTFNVGNSGVDPLNSAPDSNIILTITLSNGVPDGVPLSVIGGTFAGSFSWSYVGNTYTGIQTQPIIGNSQGTITINYMVTDNSAPDNPQNGFIVTLIPALYQDGINNTGDDETSAYTYAQVSDYGDAPSGYGVAEHVIDFQHYLGSAIDEEEGNQPSPNADGDDMNGQDDEDGVIFPEMVRGTDVNISVTVVGNGAINAWIDWNSDNDFDDPGEKIINNANRADETDNFLVSIPLNAVVSEPAFARFRFGPNPLNPSGSAGYGEVEDYLVTVLCNNPPAPAIGTITQPTCLLSTGSVVLNNLPSGNWTLIRNPGAVSTTGSGNSATVAGLPQGTYTFTVINSDGCISDPSADVVINPPPPSPQTPVIATVTQPACGIASGSVVLNELPSAGTWTLTRTPGNVTTTGTGTSTTITGLLPGTYNYTVTNSSGCTSPATAAIVINDPPPVPSAPIQSVDCTLGYGNGLVTVTSPLGTGLEYRLNDGAYQSSPQFTGVDNGNYTITVRNAQGCTSTGAQFTVFCVCVNEPSLTLSSSSGLICGTAPFTVSGNVFGGSATGVTISENGNGSINPSNSNTSPFSFTYTPATGDAGNMVTITVTTNNPLGFPCEAATATFSLSVVALPQAPVTGVTQPSCTVATGSVVLSGLPSTGTWTLTRTPGNVTTTGTGTSSTITGLLPGTYNYTVTNSSGCISPATAAIVINDPPPIPSAPSQSVDCTLGYGNGLITVTSPVGTGLEYRLNDGAYQPSTQFAGVDNGNYTITVRNAQGCTSTGAQFTVFCVCVNAPSLTLSSTTGLICGTAPFSVSGNVFGGSATGVTISENGNGSISPSNSNTSPFSFTYTPAAGDAGNTVTITVTTNNPLGFPCEAATATFTLSVVAVPQAPVIVTVTQPSCAVFTGTVVLNGLPSAGTWTLTRTPGNITTTGMGTSNTISGLMPGTYNFTVTNSAGCISTQSVNIVINQPPPPIPAPVIGTITHPTCTSSNGSVALSGLPATGTWSLLRNPGDVIITGTGTTRTIVLPEGIYTFTVTDAAGCRSLPSAEAIVNDQPDTPAAPSSGSIIQPTCSVSTGTVVLNGLPATGAWTLSRYPGTITTTGNGVTTTISGLTTGTYNFTVTNSAGCTSALSSNIIIAAQPVTPGAPVAGTITQPTCAVPTGSVNLTGLPATGTWTLTRTPGNLNITGTGTSTTAAGLMVGTYSFTVTNSSGCQSLPSAIVAILANPSNPIIVINQPDAVCSPSTVDLTSPSITAGSTTGLTYTYWTNPEGTIRYNTPETASAGIYYIMGITQSLCSDIKQVTVDVRNNPAAYAGPDQTLEYQFTTSLNADEPETGETGMWSVLRGSGHFDNPNDASTNVSGLSVGENIFLWVVANDVCTPALDSLFITVNDLSIPTLITPNNDGKNDYLIIKGIESQEEATLTIFDRRGVRVFEDHNYDNTWDGIDENGEPLPDDTYFYIVETAGRSRTGFIVIRK